MNPNDKGHGRAGCSHGVCFIKNLRFWREHRRLTREGAAGLVGVAKSTWSQWETGARSPSAEYVGMIAQALKLPPCCLFAEDVTQCLLCHARDGAAPA